MRRDPHLGHLSRLSRRDNGKPFAAIGAVAGVGSVILLSVGTACDHAPSQGKSIADRLNCYAEHNENMRGLSQGHMAENVGRTCGPQIYDAMLLSPHLSGGSARVARYWLALAA
jgi:hypothetical protein